MEFLHLLYLAVGPGIALAIYLYYSDKWEPEPRWMVVKSFLLGGFAVFPSGYIEDTLRVAFDLDRSGLAFGWDDIVYAFLVVALVEELCKVLILKAFIYEDRQFNEPFDGLVYGGIMGCGFATFENIIYVFSYGHSVGILRMITAVPGHAFLGMILGYFIGTAKFSPNARRIFAGGTLLVVLTHGLYDTIVISGAQWSFVFLFGMVSLGIYFGLRAKKELSRHSKVIEFYRKKFWVLKKGNKSGPLLLKNIRNKLADGKLEPDDVVEDVDTGKQETIKEIFFRNIGKRRWVITRFPPFQQSLLKIVIFYVVTFGFYFYFWFYRTYRQVRNYKGCRVNPELRVMSLFIVTLIPYYIFSRILGEFETLSSGFIAELSIYGFVSIAEALFFWFLLKTLCGIIKSRCDSLFNSYALASIFALFSFSAKALPLNTTGYWAGEIILLGLQGGVLAWVQKYMNLYWKLERKHWERASGEKHQTT